MSDKTEPSEKGIAQIRFCAQVSQYDWEMVTSTRFVTGETTVAEILEWARKCNKTCAEFTVIIPDQP